MNAIGMVATLFTLVLTMVLLAGYFYQRIAEHRGTAAPASLSGGRISPPRFLFLDLFRSIGENFPGVRDDSNPYRKRLVMAGYGWPSALISISFEIICSRGDLAVVPSFSSASKRRPSPKNERRLAILPRS